MMSLDSKKVTKMMREYFAGHGTASEIAAKYKVQPYRIYEYAKKLERLGVPRDKVRKSPTKSWHVIAKNVVSYVEKQNGRRTNRKQSPQTRLP